MRVLIPGLMVCLLSSASAIRLPTTVTFDDLTTTELFGEIPDGYNGLDWDEMYFQNGPAEFPGTGYDNGRRSGNYVAYNNFSRVATVSSAEPFDLVSAFFTGAWSNDLNITVRGLVGSVESYSTTFTVDYDTSTLVNFDFVGITSATFQSFGGVDADPLDLGVAMIFVMDDLTVALVPEPSIWGLFSGLIGIAAVAARRKS